MAKYEIRKREDYMNETWQVLKDGRPFGLMDSYEAAQSLVCDELGDSEGSADWALLAQMKRMLKYAINEIERERRNEIHNSPAAK